EGLPFEHPAAILVDQLPGRDAHWRDLDARPPHPPGDREAPQSPSAVAPLGVEPVPAALQDAPDPEGGLDVVDERRPPEEPDLGRKRWLVPGVAALPLDALQHRRLLAADISPRAPSQVDRQSARDPLVGEPGQLSIEQYTQMWVLVAEV